ncbi:hypothetical protein SAMN02799622_00621 [Methylobacterium sp. UNC378MF]|uniref:hypothetical protein n=1 Tax=Methylobacterium sp. UNC378MF TaxID=1502748 RepID=UPI000885963F|nr:hypothetical protein [Methylobacterium sp. UNC378MF]SDA11539.1 hypothetical protein SAMN02799622_00621 [Methylobacterium sp. UNC378MF]
MADASQIWTVFSGAGQRSSSTFAALAPKRAQTESPTPPPPDLDALAAAARAEGRREGEALAHRAAEAAAVAEREAAAVALTAARERWVEAESAVLVETFAAEIQALETRLAASLARVLQPFLTAALQQEAIRDLHATLAAIAADDQSGTLAVTGPPDLVAALARRLDLSPGQLAITTEGGPDLHIRTNGTVIETRLQAWGERVAALVEDC